MELKIPGNSQELNGFRFHSYLNTSLSLLHSYKGNEPFHFYLKNYFKGHKKHGSKDRKQISALCYNYFRIGNGANSLSTEEKIFLGTFLCENKSSLFLQFFKPELNANIEHSLDEKLQFIKKQFSVENIFSFNVELSEDIEAGKFDQSFLIQPNFFLRTRPGLHKTVIDKLSKAEINYRLINEQCIELPNDSNIESFIKLNKEAVVQDYNSQQTGIFLKSFIKNSNDQMDIWDCCAGSGGKSIMINDLFENIQLTVSDKRKSILQNLNERFRLAGIKNYYSFVADITAKNFQTPDDKFDLIIADVPCTGSGTWARTPEQLLYFNKSFLQNYTELQKNIVEKIIPALKMNGYLLYITCSVFKKENEDIVKFIEKDSSLKLKKMKLLKGYEMQSDTMFAALFIAQ